MQQENIESGWRDFLELCSKIQGPDALNDFFALFLTFEEREIMSSRYFIVKALLEKELTQREIAKKWQVSIAQITRGSNALKIIDFGFKKDLEKKLKKFCEADASEKKSGSSF